MIEAKIANLNKVLASIDKFGRDKINNAERVLRITSVNIETETKRKLQKANFIKTERNLAPSYHHAKIKGGFLVGSDVDYARWIEFGSREDPRFGLVHRRFKDGVNAFYSSVNKELDLLKRRLT